MTWNDPRLLRAAGPVLSPPSHFRNCSSWFLIVSWLVVAFMVSTPLVHAQDDTPEPSTPDVELPASDDQDAESDQDGGTPEAESAETPEASQDASSGSSTVISGTDPGSPAVLAQGLAFQTGEQVVWQVRDVDVPSVDAAEPEASNAAIILQREGSSIVRNDVTAKRALLGPGEAYFKAAEDLYTTAAQGGSSRIWVFEVVAPDAVADDAFYESPVVDDYSEATYDLQMIRYVVQPDDEVTIPAHTGTALLMASAGEIEAEDERGLQVLGVEDGQGDGQLMAGSGTVRNAGTAPAEFVFAHFGANVDDSTAGDASAPASAETPDASATTPEADAADDAASTDQATEAAPEDGAAATDDGTYQASINVTAQIDLYVTITVDGVVAFDGPIPAGGSSGAIVGSVFEVYTSSGANTLFTDACGTEFYMGYAEGEESYTLTADASSCAP